MSRIEQERAYLAGLRTYADYAEARAIGRDLMRRAVQKRDRVLAQRIVVVYRDANACMRAGQVALGIRLAMLRLRRLAREGI